VALDLRSRDLRSGTLPRTFDDPPTDPLFGRPLVYERTDDGFLLSVDTNALELREKWGLEEPVEWRFRRR
jgi:hypothetical protein